jgi:hypothetical protein
MGGSESKHANKVPVIQLGHDLAVDETVIGSAVPAAGGAAPAQLSDAAHPAGAAAGDSAEADSGSVNVGDSGLLRELREYRLTKLSLGEGAFAKVRLATSESTGHQVAVKIIKRKKLDERAELLLQREVKHHEKLRHVNIVRLHTWIKGPTKRGPSWRRRRRNRRVRGARAVSGGVCGRVIGAGLGPFALALVVRFGDVPVRPMSGAAVRACAGTTW